MKKIAFALQVFTLMAILPLCVMIELNHSTAAAKGKNPVNKVTGAVKITSPVYIKNRV
jgi:hypothetical protein